MARFVDWTGAWWERRLAAQTAHELLRRHELVGVRDGIEEVDQRRRDHGAVRDLADLTHVLGRRHAEPDRQRQIGAGADARR